MSTKVIQNNVTAFLGIEGSNSHLAAKTYFHSKGVYLSCQSIEDVFTSVLVKKSTNGIVPIENSTTGSIASTYDSLIKHKDKTGIIGEIYMQIHHYLMGKKGSQSMLRDAILYSHPQGFAQSSRFLDRWKKAEKVYSSDTATAAKTVKELKGLRHFAIANEISAHLYGLQIFSPPIEDVVSNFTRFVVVSRKKMESGTKVSLVFGVKHVPGSLVAALSSIAQFGLNLTKIESRPIIDTKWEYLFLVDVEMENMTNLKKAIKELMKTTQFIHILGIYNKGKTYES